MEKLQTTVRTTNFQQQVQLINSYKHQVIEKQTQATDIL